MLASTSTDRKAKSFFFILFPPPERSRWARNRGLFVSECRYAIKTLGLGITSLLKTYLFGRITNFGKIKGSDQFFIVVLLHLATDCADFNVRIRVGQEATINK